jgi:hypothetical protein
MNTLNDIFIEKLVRRKPTASIILVKILVAFAALVICVSILFTPLAGIAGPIIWVVVVWLAWFLIRRLNYEFEYSLTNGDLDIDTIIGFKKRVHMLSLHSYEIELMAPFNSQYADRYPDQDMKTIYDVASSKDSPDRWILIFRKDGSRCKLIFEPNQRMIEGLHRYNPQNVMYSQEDEK